MTRVKPNIKIGVTHHGTFHADDVFSTALLKIIYPDIQIIRVNEVPSSLKHKKEAIVYDIGMGKYDHHCTTGEFRSNGIEYASFGKLWRDFGEFLLPNPKSRCYIDSALVQEIDRTDNGQGMNTLSMAIKSFNIAWNESEDKITGQFNLAVDVAKQVLENMIRRKLSEEEADKVYEEASKYQTNHVLVLPRYIPLSPNIRENIWFVIYPSNRKGYNLSMISNRRTGFRKPIPNEWRESNPKGMNYIQDEGGKIVNFDTLENAITAANSILDFEDRLPFLDLLIQNEWTYIGFDSELVEVDRVFIMDNESCCPAFGCQVYSLTPLEVTEDDKLSLSKDRYFGSIIDYTGRRTYEQDNLVMNRYNESASIKIRQILYKNGTVNNYTRLEEVKN